MTFSELPIGAIFNFTNEQENQIYNGFLQGPWRKVSPRCYRLKIGAESGRHSHQVRSVKQEVMLVEETP